MTAPDEIEALARLLCAADPTGTTETWRVVREERRNHLRATAAALLAAGVSLPYCQHCGDPLTWHTGNGGQWLGALPPRDWTTCRGVPDGQRHEPVVGRAMRPVTEADVHRIAEHVKVSRDDLTDQPSLRAQIADAQARPSTPLEEAPAPSSRLTVTVPNTNDDTFTPVEVAGLRGQEVRLMSGHDWTSTFGRATVIAAGTDLDGTLRLALDVGDAVADRLAAAFDCPLDRDGWKAGIGYHRDVTGNLDAPPPSPPVVLREVSPCPPVAEHVHAWLDCDALVTYSPSSHRACACGIVQVFKSRGWTDLLRLTDRPLTHVMLTEEERAARDAEEEAATTCTCHGIVHHEATCPLAPLLAAAVDPHRRVGSIDAWAGKGTASVNGYLRREDGRRGRRVNLYLAADGSVRWR